MGKIVYDVVNRSRNVLAGAVFLLKDIKNVRETVVNPN